MSGFLSVFPNSSVHLLKSIRSEDLHPFVCPWGSFWYHKVASVPSFSLKYPHSVHEKTTAVCLSYLSHDVPRRPLR
ncbi:hypothetical protein F5Y07DRAFT_370446 [Xylaria sp. FL0933]|nr:hypothetical protein F5Y07DRAFT_370446 [Xylaria sp. FL0933]